MISTIKHSICGDILNFSRSIYRLLGVSSLKYFTNFICYQVFMSSYIIIYNFVPGHDSVHTYVNTTSRQRILGILCQPQSPLPYHWLTLWEISLMADKLHVQTQLFNVKPISRWSLPYLCWVSIHFQNELTNNELVYK